MFERGRLQRNLASELEASGVFRVSLNALSKVLEYTLVPVAHSDLITKEKNNQPSPKDYIASCNDNLD